MRTVLGELELRMFNKHTRESVLKCPNAIPLKVVFVSVIYPSISYPSMKQYSSTWDVNELSSGLAILFNTCVSVIIYLVNPFNQFPGLLFEDGRGYASGAGTVIGIGQHTRFGRYLPTRLHRQRDRFVVGVNITVIIQ